MSCWETIADYAFRSIGIGERLLPRSDFTLCQQFTLIGSGLLWNIYFGVLALTSGFLLATAVAMGKAARNPLIRKPSEWFIFIFRGCWWRPHSSRCNRRVRPSAGASSWISSEPKSAGVAL